ncbi:ABC transporter ATP-binding protein [Undibacterium sp. SXout7W]|uniref:ABC transporter ATP-binding protein n=1 Tax=Undibacterium sp. SXout7W TaxID=3413049 RepID=UPI003BF14C5A
METRALDIVIADRQLVRQLNWQVMPGECWCIIGRNGAGKTSLLRTLAGLRPTDGGQVFLQNKLLPDWSLMALARERAFLSQGRVDAFAYSAIDTVLSARHPYHDTQYWESGDDLTTAMAALKALDVEHLAQRDVRSLSGGERQRVAIAALLAQDAQLMLLDEPANALDLAHQISVMQLLSRLCKEQKKSVVMVSHDLNLAQSIATHALLLMGNGQWLAGRAHDILTEQQLTACLGHPIQRIEYQGQILFVPQH